MLKRIFAIFRARNREFLRDRGSLSWNIVLPVALVFGLSWIFADGNRAEFTVGVLGGAEAIDEALHPFLGTRYVDFVPVASVADGELAIARHRLDLLFAVDPAPRYWVNPDSSRGYFAERTLLQLDPDARRVAIRGDAVRYVDWVLPGILGMNMMFSCLFGVGYVVVRYRKNGFLKRLRATPLRAIEFVIAQVASRLLLIVTITSAIFAGTSWLLDVRMDGSYLLLLLVAVCGAVALISMGLVVAARVTSEELAGGLLNMVSWPMMLLSGVWFSLESAEPWVRSVAQAFPLTHVLDAARAVMLDAAGPGELAEPLLTLLLMSAVFLSLAALLFRWRAD